MTLYDDPKPDFKWPVSATQTIAAPPENVWRVISMPANLEACHPFCDKNIVEKWPGEGSADVLHYLNGVMYERRFTRWIEGVGYDLEIGRKNGRISFVSWRIIPIEDDSCQLRIAVYPHTIDKYPVVVRWIPFLARIQPMLKSYLSSVVRGFEWYVTRGEPVPRNQFGVHPWFSVEEKKYETA